MFIPFVRLVPIALPDEVAGIVWPVFGWLVVDELLGLLPVASLVARLSTIAAAVVGGVGVLWIRRKILARGRSAVLHLVLFGIHAAMLLLGVSRWDRLSECSPSAGLSFPH